MTGQNQEFDVLIIGSGAAGLGLALELPSSVRIGLLTKGALQDSNTYFAQGGIAAVLDETDTTDSHVADTLVAGGGLCNENAVRFIVEHGRAAIERLIDLGVGFSQEEDTNGVSTPHLTREGGHSHRRVVHVADATGREVEMTLIERVSELSNVTILEHHMAVDLVRETDSDGRRGRCIGLYALNTKEETVLAYSAKATVMATGGASKVYLYTSNPDGATGDGTAIAWRAGCRVANMEFTQFHPTCLYHPEAKSFLITEAVRGEGGLLLLPNGSRFMDRFHEKAELAPRDVVARAIDHEMKRLGVESVFLDISHKSADFIHEHFPTVQEQCWEFGIDITKEPIPVVPAAHYTCGGVDTDLSGRTNVNGLYAAGEVAHTGLHGANRMASNSLLECLVLSRAVAKDIEANLSTTPAPPSIRQWDESRVRDSDEDVVVSHNWDELRRFMWDYVGIVRTTKRLERAKHRVDLLRSEISEYYGNYRVTGDLLELRNLTVVADLIIRSAMMRTESRGLHYTLDHPDLDGSRTPQDTILVPPQR